MKLNEIPLNAGDMAVLSDTRAIWRDRVKSGSVKDGIIRHGVTLDDGEIFLTKTVGEEEYVHFTVFVAKIRRESYGLDVSTRERQRKWYEMAKQFVAEFGEKRTPPDIVWCTKHWKEILDA